MRYLAVSFGVMFAIFAPRPVWAVDDPGADTPALPASSLPAAAVRDAPAMVVTVPAAPDVMPAPLPPGAPPPADMVTPADPMPPTPPAAPPPPVPPPPPLPRYSPEGQAYLRPPPGEAEAAEDFAAPRFTEVRFQLNRTGESWTLTDAYRHPLCQLPCTWLVPPDAGLRLSRSALNGHGRTLDLKVPDLDWNRHGNPPLRAVVKKNKHLAAAIGYGAIMPSMTVAGAIIGSIVAASMQAPTGWACGGPYAGTCIVVERPPGGPGAGAGFGIGLLTGAVLGVVTGTIVYYAWNPLRVEMVREGE